MFKKSLLIGAFFISGVRGAAGVDCVLTHEVHDLNWVAAQIGYYSLFNSTVTDVEKPKAIQTLLEAARVLKENSSITLNHKFYFGYIAYFLEKLGDGAGAIDLYQFILGLNDEFASSKVSACLGLYRLGQQDLAITKINELITNASLDFRIRCAAIDHFF